MVDYLGSLFARATGGAEVAARPVAQSDLKLYWNATPTPAGVATVQQWFKNRMSKKELSMVFLVGGPGGGKSHAAAQMVSELNESLQLDPDLAHRLHQYVEPESGRPVMLINDATIPNANFPESSSLVSDIEAAISSNANFIACVNRGILVDEASELGDEHSVAEEILLWLAGSRGTGVSRSNHLESIFSNGILQEGRIVLEDQVIGICVVYFDSTSLFESKPESGLIEKLEPSSPSVFCKRYDVASFAERLRGNPVESPATQLLGLVAESVTFHSKLEPKLDPISANLQSLSSPQLRQALSNIFRAAEIVSDRHFTYRELWGIAAKAIVGDLPSQIPSDEVENKLREMAPKSSNALEVLSSYQNLAGLRFSQALFAGTVKANRPQISTLQDPVLRTLTVVDPIRDMQPQVLFGAQEISLASAISDAFSGTLVNGSPLQALGTIIGPTNLFHKILTPFDQAIDEAFIAAIQSDELKDASRRNLVSWYASYLSRLLACANSISAFSEIVTLWAEIWRLSQLPSEIEQCFLTLLRPSRSGHEGEIDDSSLIPLFESRTSPIVGTLSAPKFALRVDDLKLRVETRGDQIFLVLEEHSNPVSTVLLDFPLLREAMACIPKFTGVTELSAFTAPRIERIRASNLTPERLGRLGQFKIAMESGERAITVKAVD